MRQEFRENRVEKANLEPRDQVPHSNIDARLHELIERRNEALLNPRVLNDQTTDSRLESLRIRSAELVTTDFLQSRDLELVALKDLPETGITDADYRKIPKQRVEATLQRWRGEIAPAIAKGHGLSLDYWQAMDEAKNLPHDSGYAKAFSVLCEPLGAPIQLVQSDNGWQVINGNHRIQVARELGLEYLPARVKRL